MAYVSTYPKTFDRFLRFKDITFNSNAGAEELRLYATFDIWIAAAYEAISRHCNQVIQSTAGTVISFRLDSLITDDTGNDYYLLPVLKVPITISTVTGRSDIFDSVTTISADNWDVITVNGLQRLYFVSGSAPYTYGYVTATVGYTDTNMPEEIHRVASEMVAEIYSESDLGKHRLGETNQGENFQGVGTTTGFYELTERHKKALKPYTIIAV